MIPGSTIGAYLVIAALAMVPTLLEQRANRIEGPLRLAGLLACLLWPLSFAAVAILVLRTERRKRHPSVPRPQAEPL